MLVYAFFLLLWLLTTMLGVWVVVRLMQVGPSQDEPPFDLAKDIRAASRVLNRLENQGLIDREQSQQWRNQLIALSRRDTQVSPNRLPAMTTDEDVIVAELVEDDTPSRVDSPSAAVPSPGAAVPPGIQPAESPITRPRQEEKDWLAGARNQPQPAAESASAPQFEQHLAATVKREPSLSMSEVITSFLAAHNIRWGELVAGMLIVICSIGLVISLWNTLMETHRVVPSLIFLAANTAIFSAGLYTLSRWRLRDTSRAVLIIASLLVPLSVLAGLATAGTGSEAVSLNDPITVVSIVGIGGVYFCLLWLGSRALVGKRDAGAMLLSVGGPAAMLPLLPAAIRTFGASAAFLVAGGSFALTAALSWVVLQSHQTQRRVLGTATGRHRLLIMSVGSFAFSVLIANVAFTMPEHPHQLLRIAIAAIPGLIALSATGGTLSHSRRSPNLALTGTVISILAAAASFLVLPPALVGADWLWAWAGTLCGSALLAAWAFRQPQWLPIATLGAGLGLLMWSPVYLQGVTWQELPLWKRFVGGEAMLVALAVGGTSLLASRFLRRSDYRNPLQLAGFGWIAFSLLIATILSVSPLQWLGSVPAWVVTALLVAAATVSMLGAPTELVSKYSGWAAVPLWLSILRPVTLGLPLAAPRVWMMTTLAIAATLLLASVLARMKGITSFFLAGRPRTKPTIDYWLRLSAAMSIVAAVIAGIFVSHDWVDAATALATSTLLLWVVGLASQQVVWIQVAQITSLGAAVVVGWGRFRPSLLSLESWQTGIAPWGWAILLALVALMWLGVRELCLLVTGRTDNESWVSRFAIYRDNDASPAKLLEWPLTLAALLTILGVAVESFVALAAGVFDNAILAIEPTIGLPLLAISGVSAAMMLARRQLPNTHQDHWGWAAVTGVVSVLVWSGSLLAIWLLEDPAERLVLGTTVIALACCGLDYWIRTNRQLADLVGQLFGSVVGASLIGVSSLVLLATGWWEDVFAGQKPQVFETCWVAAWSATGMILTGWMGWKHRDVVAASLSAVLAPAAVFLVMPLMVVDSPTSWLQWSAIASGAWALAAGWCFRGQPATSEPARNGSLVFVAVIGVACAALMIVHVLLPKPYLAVFGSWGGLIVSLLATAMILTSHQKFVPKQPFLAPLAITLLSGQATGLVVDLGWIRNEMTLLASIWLVAAAASLVFFARSVLSRKATLPVIHFWHAAIMSIAVCLLCVTAATTTSYLVLGLIGCLVGGLLITAVAWSRPQVREDLRSPWLWAEVSAARLLGWFVLFVGAYFASQITDLAPGHWDTWSAIVTWIGIWVLWWRVSCPDTITTGSREPALPLAQGVLPDSEATSLVAAGLLVELLLVVNAAEHLPSLASSDPLLWLRASVAGLIGVTCLLRGSRKNAVETSLLAALSAITLIAVCVGLERGADWHQRIMIASLVASTTIAILVYMSRTILPIINQLAASWMALIRQSLVRDADSVRALPLAPDRFGLAMWRLSLIASSVISVTLAVLLVTLDTDPSVPLAIGAIALISVSVAELSEQTGQIKMRYATVVLGFLATAMWASVNVGTTPFPVLTVAMQWLVGWVLTAAVVGLVVPKLFGAAFADRWQPALRFGVILAGALAAGSMVLMFASETWIRLEADIDLVSRTRVYFVATTLAVLSVVATLLGILSGPGFGYRDTWRFNDRVRTSLIIAAQVVGGLTWLHLHLCNSPLAHLGLRPYWPYIVMLLSFVSVGITEWARRRDDAVLRETLRKTALYLPLVPVLGFWLSSATVNAGGSDPANFAWAYIQGKVSYQTLLAIGALYYGGLAFLWKGTMPRVTSIVLANAALWVILIQMPGWNFLTHPQAWLIPPAVCVLAVTHLHRHRLEAKVASSIRYAATLTIYVSSTADMLLQDIGSTLSGPIILVLLALAGMIAGVALRVRPFLYLGAIFVFIGVTSMVWHAQQRIDQVWPWWAFGITTGILLLAGLMAIEKNRPKLQSLASSLAKWES